MALYKRRVTNRYGKTGITWLKGSELKKFRKAIKEDKKPYITKISMVK